MYHTLSASKILVYKLRITLFPTHACIFIKPFDVKTKRKLAQFYASCTWKNTRRV